MKNNFFSIPLHFSDENKIIYDVILGGTLANEFIEVDHSQVISRVLNFQLMNEFCELDVNVMSTEWSE